MPADRPEDRAPAEPAARPPGPHRPGPATAAADAFVVANIDRLRAYAAVKLAYYRVPSGRLEVDDVVQYTVAELLDRWAEIREPAKYMFTVARRHILRAAIEGGRFTGAPRADDEPDRQHVLDQLPAEQAPVDEQVERRLIRHHLVGEVRTALAGLTPPQRTATRLVDGLGMSRADAAGVMGVADGTVSPHLQRGRTKLRTTLAHLRTVLYGAVVLGGLGGLGWLAWRLISAGSHAVTHVAPKDLLALALSVAPLAPLAYRLVRWSVRWHRASRYRRRYVLGDGVTMGGVFHVLWDVLVDLGERVTARRRSARDRRPNGDA